MGQTLFNYILRTWIEQNEFWGSEFKMLAASASPEADIYVMILQNVYKASNDSEKNHIFVLVLCNRQLGPIIWKLYH